MSAYTPEEAARIVELTRTKEEPRVEPGERPAPNDYPFYGPAGADAHQAIHWRKRALEAEAKLAAMQVEAADRKKLVVIESPFASFKADGSHDPEGQAENVRYARRLMLDALRRGEYPFASHLLYPQVLDDLQPEERKLGIEAGLAWAKFASVSIVGPERGISNGMKLGIERAVKEGRLIVERRIDGGEKEVG